MRRALSSLSQIIFVIFFAAFAGLSPLHYANAQAVRAHTIKFFIDPELVPDAAYAKDMLAKYVADMNYILAKNTNRRFMFDPQTGLIATSTKPSSSAGGRLPADGYEIWAEISSTSAPYSNGGFMSFDKSGAGVLAGLKWTRLYDRDALMPDTNESRDYSIQIDHMLHEFGHVAGAGIGEYYNLSTINDTTGEPPLLNIRLNDYPNDPYWSDKPDFMPDPMLAMAYGQSRLGNPTDWNRVRDIVKYSSLTAAVVNGSYRAGSPHPTVDLSRIKVAVKNRTGQPVPGALVKVWQVKGIPGNPATLLASGTTSPDGTYTFAWGGPADPHSNYDFLRLIKAYKDGASQARYVSIFDADKSRMVFHRPTHIVNMSLNWTAPMISPTPSTVPAPIPRRNRRSIPIKSYVDPSGFEPLTSSLQMRRSTN